MRIPLHYPPSSTSKKPKRCTYSVISGSLAETSRALEERFSSLGIRPIRLIDPECYTLESLAESLCESEHIGIVEVRRELNRMFYLFPERVEFEEELEFDVFTPEGLKYLLKLICEGKIDPKKRRRFSMMTFLVSMVGGVVTSAFFEPKSYWDFLLSSVLIAIVVLLIALLIDWPSLILPFKGVRLVEKKKKTKITKISFPPSALEFLEKK
ncbi:hypothetical protein [Thermococcus litoralis]|uniref:hypothetical protein n=1 Tax=Thermococcus litoralis TaxID=2265 RepID=UPI00024E2C34|nr:hypothetical protein [Thermococcus litoralis]